MDINSLLSPTQRSGQNQNDRDPPRSVPSTSTPGSPSTSPFKQVQRTYSGPLPTVSKPALGISPLSQTVLTQANLPAHLLSSSQQNVSSPLISPVPITSQSQLGRAGSSTPSMDALADAASIHTHQPAMARPPLSSSHLSYETQRSPSYPTYGLTSNPRHPSISVAVIEAPKSNIRTDFSGTSLPVDQQEKLAQLATHALENPSTYDAHVEMINILHRGLVEHIYPLSDSSARRDPRSYDLLADLRNSREQMSKIFAVGETLWCDWLQDESLLAQSADDRIGVVEKCRKAVEEEVGSIRLWCTYAEWVQHCYNWANDIPAGAVDEERLTAQQVFTWQLVMETWHEGLEQTGHNLKDSHVVWNKYLRTRLPTFDTQLSSELVPTCLSLFQDRLQVPHAAWEDTFQTFSGFVSANYADQYEQIMTETNQMAAHAKEKMAARELFEAALERAQASEDKDAEYLAFTNYIAWEQTPEKRKKLDPVLLNAVYERAELSFASDPALWEEHAMYLLDSSGKHKLSGALALLRRASKHCPWSGSLWSQYLITSDRLGQSFDEIENIKHQATSAGLLEAAGIEEVVKVHAAWCSYLRRRSFRPDGVEEDIDVAEMGIRSSIENLASSGATLGLDAPIDPSFRLNRIYITFLTESGRWDNARQEFDNLVREYGKLWEFWIRFYQWEMMRWRRFASAEQDSGDMSMSNVAPPHLATAVLKKALDQPSLDYPEPIMQALITHCEDYEDAEELQAALLRIKKLEKTVATRRQVEAAQISQSNGPHGTKRKHEDGMGDENDNHKKARSEEAQQSVEQTVAQHPKRDREHASILVENLPDHVTDTKVRQYFSNCGTVRALTVLREDGISAIVEFEDDDAAKYALSRDGQEFEGAILSVGLDTGSTVYLANYKPSADRNYIQNLLGKYGEIINVRFPSLQGNKRRRFCYVQFKTPSEAEAATELDGEDIDGLALTCKISNPAIKKSRDAHHTVNDGRTVFVGQLNFQATEEEVKKFFAKFGDIERIRMPRDERAKNRNKGIAFVTYSSLNEASEALQSNGREIRGREISVKIAKNVGREHNVKGATRSTASPTPATNGKASSPTLSSNTENAAEERRERCVFVTNVPDTVNAARLEALGAEHGNVLRVILKTNHQGAIFEYGTIAEAGEASIRLQGHEIDPGRALHVVTETEMLARNREKKIENFGAKTNHRSVPAPTPIGSVAPIRRPGQPTGRKGGNLGQRMGLGFTKKPSAMESGDKLAVNGNGKKSNDEFRALINKKDT